MKEENNKTARRTREGKTKDMEHTNKYNHREQEQKARGQQQLEEEKAREEKIEQLCRELEEEKARHLRTRADLDNYRKRMGREAEAVRINAKKEILFDLLTFLDYFDQAKKQVRDPAATEGIEIMSRQFRDLLHKHGVRPVECLGRPFDPQEQEGIGYMKSEKFDEGCVCEELSPGYKLGEVLLKPARVMVAQKPDRQSD